MTSKKIAVITSMVLVLAVGSVLGWVILSNGSDKKTTPSTAQEVPQTSEAPQEENPLSFNKSQFSIDDPASLWIIVNKQRALPSSFTPANLVDTGNGQRLQSDAAQALKDLFTAASKDGVSLRPVSGYRAFTSQQQVYNSYVQKDGVAKADTYSARPGHSEHQTGLAIDVGNGSGQCDLEICFGTTNGGKWVATNAYRYGFVIRYHQDKTAITGYSYEPWHLRYVGVDLATELRNGQTMEEFFGLPAAPGY